MNSSTDQPQGIGIFGQLFQQFPWFQYLFMLFTAAACVCNFVIGMMILKKRERRRQKSNSFLLILLLSHFLINGEAFGYSITYYVYTLNHHPILCKDLHQYLFGASLFIVHSANIFITLDRYIAIMHSFYYQRLGLKFPITGGILILLLGVATFLAQMYGPAGKTNLIITTSSTFGTLILLCFANFRIYLVVKDQFCKIRAVIVDENKTVADKLKRNLMLREIKATRICLRIVMTYAVMQFPGPLDILLEYTIHKYRSIVPRGIVIGMILLGATNGIVDPLIYLQGKAEIRKELRQIFHNLLCIKTRSTKTSSNSGI